MPEQAMGLILPIGVLVVFYFMLIRPQQQRDKKVKEMRKNLKVGDEIVTIGGIHGKITKVKEELLTIEVGADKVKLSVTKWAIGSVISQEKNID